MEQSTPQMTLRDTQNARPAVPVALSRAGVTDLRRIISINAGNKPQLFYASIDLFADLSPEYAGVHMSRFSEVVEGLAEGFTRRPFPDIESLASRMAEQIVATQAAYRAEVRIKTQSPLVRRTPVTDRPTEQLYTLVGIAAATPHATRLVVGVEVNGLTVCPCAQDMVRAQSREQLLQEGFTEDQISCILSVVPVASHNQRGRGTLLVGSRESLRAEDLVKLVEQSMSSEIYELLKRPDELYVVDKAHRNPRFVEDAVREMLRLAVAAYPNLPDEDFIIARQENFEGIHDHNAFAERYGTLGDIRHELAGGAPVERHITLEEWLAP